MIQRLTPAVLAAAALVAALLSPIVFSPPATAAPPPGTDAPRGSPGVAPSPDHELMAVLARLDGTFATAASAGSPALRWHMAPVRVEDLANTVYFELARADRPAQPQRQGVMQVFRRQGELRLRLFDLSGEPGLKDVLVGLWAVPDTIPRLPLVALRPEVDFVLTREGEGWRGRTPHPYPTVRGGAIETTAEIAILPDQIQIADRGLDAAGARVWGQEPGEMLEFVPAAPTAAAVRRDSGLISIDLVPPDPGHSPLAPGGNIAVHYTGWLTSGYRFEDSRADGRPPLRTRIPGTGIAGIDEGLLGMTPGTRRRLVIPAELGFGDAGSVRGRIPPGATLIYDFEALEVQNSQAPGAPDAAPARPRGED